MPCRGWNADTNGGGDPTATGHTISRRGITMVTVSIRPAAIPPRSAKNEVVGPGCGGCDSDPALGLNDGSASEGFAAPPQQMGDNPRLRHPQYEQPRCLPDPR